MDLSFRLAGMVIAGKRMSLIGLSAAMLAAGLSAAADGTSASMPGRHRAFFQSYCVECHDAEKQKGKVRLDDLPFDITDIQTADRWQKILNSLNSGEMPPEDEKQPTAADKTGFLESLSHVMVAARKKLTDQGGLITMRRLNRREYENTIRDLLGVRVNVKSLPPDSGSSGFDTAGKSLFFSSDQLEQYLALARIALDEVLVPPGPQPVVRREIRQCEGDAQAEIHKGLARWGAELAKAEQAIATGDSKKFGYPDVDRAKFMKGQADLRLPLNQHLIGQPLLETGALLTPFTGCIRDTTTIPADAPPGRYLLRVRAGALPGANGRRQFLEFGQRTSADSGDKGGFVTMGCHRITGTPEQPQVIEIPVTVTRSGSRSFILREREPGEKAVVAFFREMSANKIGPLPMIWLDSVEWEGPLVTDWPPAAWQQIFFKGPGAQQTTAYAREIIARFAVRAFRGKPVEPVFLDKLVQSYERRHAAGDSFENALRDPMAIVLASPSFLYLVEPVLAEGGADVAAPRKPVALSGVEIASRLSYFLWSAPPDDELMALAKNGRLLVPDVLAGQTDRLLNDPKSYDFVTGFLSQWLHMERLDFFQFNPSLYPEFDATAKLAARDEVFQTFHCVLRESLPLQTLLKSDFVVINDLLAGYYGFNNINGAHYRKVPVPAGSPRGGMLGMAAVLAMGSDGERSSPVERGAFVLRKLLNNPPPPAPANVPQLSRLAGQMLSARQLLSSHMEEAQCAQCHRRIDPIGFGLENFNAAGLWRTEEVIATALTGRKAIVAAEKDKAGGTRFAIDPGGELPDGTAFKDYFQLRDEVAKRHEAFARGLTEALIEYGLGRPFGFSDENLAEETLNAARTQGHTPRALILALVQSKPFHTK